MWKPANWTARTESLLLAGLTWLCFIAIECGLNPSGWPMALVWASHGLVLTLVLNAVLLATRNWPPIIKFAVAAVSVVVLGLTQARLDIWVASQFMRIMLGPNSVPELVRLDPNGQATDIKMMINVAIYLWMFGFFAAAVTLMIARRAAFEAKFAAQTAQLEALRLQLAPHFLFNALNSISTLILVGRAKEAEEMTNRLSAFFRATLMTSGSDAVSLDAELGTISDYLDVERVRFGDKLVVSVSCEPELSEAVVPGLILQPLVENVIKHAVSAADVPVRLSITAARVNDRLRIAIEDDHAGTPAAAPMQSGVGVRNTRQRLATLYGKDATVETGPMTTQGYRSVLDFPLRYDATL